MAGKWRTVRTNTELAKVLADGDYAEIVGDGYYEISGSATVTAYDSATVRASGSATVTASGSATVRASGSATVRASGSATVRASGSATVTAYGSATVTASGSATVTASGSATVRASGSATVTAYGSATVTAYGSATVTAYGSATVRASGSATVTAYDSATVTAYDSATVRASNFVAVHQLSMRSTITGGVVITPPDLTDAEAWCDYYGIKPSRGFVTLYKGVDDNWLSGYGTSYKPGTKPSAPDWKPTNECGYGLHFSPRPSLTHNYCDPKRYVAVKVRLADLIPIGDAFASDKCKAPACTVLYECDEDGRELPIGAAA